MILLDFFSLCQAHNRVSPTPPSVRHGARRHSKTQPEFIRQMFGFSQCNVRWSFRCLTSLPLVISRTESNNLKENYSKTGENSFDEPKISVLDNVASYGITDISLQELQRENLFMPVVSRLYLSFKGKGENQSFLFAVIILQFMWIDFESSPTSLRKIRFYLKSNHRACIIVCVSLRYYSRSACVSDFRTSYCLRFIFINSFADTVAQQSSVWADGL